MNYARSGQSCSKSAVEELIEVVRVNDVNALLLEQPVEPPHQAQLDAGPPIHDEVGNSESSNFRLESASLVYRAEQAAIFIGVQSRRGLQRVHLGAAGHKRPGHLHDSRSFIELRIPPGLPV